MFTEWPEWKDLLYSLRRSQKKLWTWLLDSEPGIYAIEAPTIPNSVS